MAGTCALAGAALGKTVAQTKKKGFGVVHSRTPMWNDQLKKLQVDWFYSWGLEAPQSIPAGIEFVPMMWSKWGCTAEKLAAVKAAGHRTLLGFNEPDQHDQANISVEKAIELWPLLMDAGLRLGSPAGVQPDGEWMQAFMNEIQKRGYRVDFITLHSYMGSNPRHFLKKIEKIHKLYRRPLWITEFAVADWDARKDKPNKYDSGDVLKFMEKALPALNRSDYVERYAWFSGTGFAVKPSRLFNDDGSLTGPGRFYAAL